MSCIYFMSFSWTLAVVHGDGLLLLYRPRDISNECTFSQHLRYDLSFGMGMSDTITFVFRTLTDFDYECVVEVTSESSDIHLIVVIRFPNSIANNCAVNRDAFTVLKKWRCLRLCDLVGSRDVETPYYVISLRERLRFRFISNSSLNSDMNANLYQVTVTAARVMPPGGCSHRNETICTINDQDFCFTSGVVCDGINNCGVTDWFDERKAQCGLPVEKLGYAPVVAVLAVVVCGLLVAGRALIRCLPPDTASFFIFNANEDNRLCIDTVFRAPEPGPSSIEDIKRTSIIPVFSDTSSESNEGSKKEENTTQQIDDLDAIQHVPQVVLEEESKRSSSQKITLKSVTKTLQRKLLVATSQIRRASVAAAPSRILDI